MARSRGNPEKGGQAALETANVSAAELQKYLKGVSYPAEKQDLVDAADNNGAPDNVLEFFNQLPDKTFNRPMDVEQELSKSQGSSMAQGSRTTQGSSKTQEFSKTK